MTKRIAALILTVLALASLAWCVVNAISLIKEYLSLSGQNASGVDYLGVYFGFCMQCAAAFIGCVFSAVAFFLADRKWIKWAAGLTALLLIASVLVVIFS